MDCIRVKPSLDMGDRNIVGSNALYIICVIIVRVNL